MNITYGSVCSGIEAASVAWHPLGWRAAWLAEIEPFPSFVLHHHYGSGRPLHMPSPNDAGLLDEDRDHRLLALKSVSRLPDTIAAGAPRNLGDFTRIVAMVRAGTVAAPDVLIGGTPCQAFSIAGLRNSLDDARGQLTLAFVDLANAIDTTRIMGGKPASIVVWENVPGVLSTKDNAFGCFLGALAGEDCELVAPGGKWPNAGCVVGPQRTIAWRVTDAQYFGVPQRRRRVFVVASARKGFDPTEVLFEFDGVRRDTAPSRQTGQDAAAGTLRSTDGGSDVDHAGSHANAGSPPAIAFDSRQDCVSSTELFGALGSSSPQAQAVAFCQNTRDEVRLMNGDGQIVGALSAQPGMKQTCYIATCITGEITHTLKAEGFDASEDGTGCGQPIVAAVALRGREGGATIELMGDLSGCLRASSGGSDKPHALVGLAVRRLTPTECERLQAFPDFHTLIPISIVKASRAETMLAKGDPVECIDGVWWKMAADGPRYKALGNSMCTNNISWIGRRIELVLAQQMAAAA